MTSISAQRGEPNVITSTDPMEDDLNAGDFLSSNAAI